MNSSKNSAPIAPTKTSATTSASSAWKSRASNPNPVRTTRPVLFKNSSSHTITAHMPNARFTFRPLLLIPALLAAFCSLAWSQQNDSSDPPADRPLARSDRNSRIAHEQLLEKARKGRIDICFVGDSITRRWGATDHPQFLAHWNTNFFGWNAANFGWGGDKIENILWRLENGELDRVRPKIIVLLAGINNVATVPGGEARIENIT